MSESWRVRSDDMRGCNNTALTPSLAPVASARLLAAAGAAGGEAAGGGRAGSGPEDEGPAG
jgi:hypothetical protein